MPTLIASRVLIESETRVLIIYRYLTLEYCSANILLSKILHVFLQTSAQRFTGLTPLIV